MQLYRGYRYRIYPTQEQRQQFGKLFMTVRFVYNSLRLRWMDDSRLDFQLELSRLVGQEKWLKFIHPSILNHTARQLEQACRRYEEAVKSTGKGGPLTSSHRVDCSARGTAVRGNAVPSGGNAAPSGGNAVPSGGNAAPSGRNAAASGRNSSVPALPRRKCKTDARSSFTLSCRNITVEDGRLLLAGQSGIKPVKIVLSRPVPSTARICSATVSMLSSGEYYVSLLCRFPSGSRTAAFSAARTSFSGRAVGLDYSLSSFFIASDPALKPDWNYLMNAKKSRKKLAAANRRLSAMQHGSANYLRQRRVVAGIHEHIRNQRRDYLQKLSTRIADNYDVVCVETLDLIEMEKTCHGYARKVADNGWEDFVQMLDYKLKERGKSLVRVDKWFPSSKICHECSYINRNLTVSDRVWVCPVCGAKHDRDVNASRNIRDEGLRILKTSRRGSSCQGKNAFPAMQASPGNHTGSIAFAEPGRRYYSSHRSGDSFSQKGDAAGSFWAHGPYGWEYRSGSWDSPANAGSSAGYDDVHFQAEAPLSITADWTDSPDSLLNQTSGAHASNDLRGLSFGMQDPGIWPNKSYGMQDSGIWPNKFSDVRDSDDWRDHPASMNGA